MIIPDWTPCKEKLPNKKGDYLVTTDYGYICRVSFAKNLHKVDKYDFCGKNRPGFYDYDSEYGYYEVSDVIAWTKLPPKYEPELEEK